jgi:glycosyltransferase involved in cell wall biosynthesis
VIIDVIIPTKDRPVRLHNAIAQARAAMPGCRVIVVDSSSEPTPLGYPADLHLRAPPKELGKSRSIGLEACVQKLAVYMDDDVMFPPGWLAGMMATMEKTGAAVVSSRIIYGAPLGGTIARLYRHSEARNVGGAALLVDVEKLRLRGGWCDAASYGEDTECAIRLGSAWVVSDTEVWHPVSFMGWMHMAAYYSAHLARNIKRGVMPKRYAVRALGAPFTMPIYYGWKSRSVMVAVYYFFYRTVYAFGMVKGILGGSE